MKFFAALAALLIAGVLAHQALWSQVFPAPPEVAWVKQLEATKWRAARQAESPKILIVGGSEAHYGLSAAIFERETGLPAVNLGTHAALDWRTHALNALRFAEAGDVVVFSMNINRLAKNDPSETEAAYWRYTGPFYFLRRPPYEWPDFLGADVVTEIAEALTAGRIRYNARSRADSVIENGDETRNGPSGMRARAERGLTLLTGNTAIYDGRPEGLTTLRHLQDALEARGARLVLVHHGQLDKRNYRNRLYQDSFDAVEALLEAEGFVRLNSLEQSFLPEAMMFDTIYHPNHEGRRLVSEPAARSLDALLKTDPAAS